MAGVLQCVKAHTVYAYVSMSNMCECVRDWESKTFIASRNVLMCVWACTWSLEVDASHLHRVGGMVRCDLSVVEQTFGAWLWFLPFAAWKSKHTHTQVKTKIVALHRNVQTRQLHKHRPTPNEAKPQRKIRIKREQSSPCGMRLPPSH